MKKKLARAALALVFGVLIWAAGACLTKSSFDTVGGYGLVLTVSIALLIILVALALWLRAGQCQ